MVVIQKRIRINEWIRLPQVRAIGKDGEQLGVMPVEDAIRLAQEAKLDLVEVAPNAEPPVCRIMDFTKFKYDQEKKERDARKHQKGGRLKEIRLKPKIEEHDYQFKLNHIHRFLKQKDKVKVTLIYRGREMSHPEFGQRVIDRLIKDLSGIADIEKGPFKENKSIMVFFAPK